MSEHTARAATAQVPSYPRSEMRFRFAEDRRIVPVLMDNGKSIDIDDAAKTSGESHDTLAAVWLAVFGPVVGVPAPQAEASESAPEGTASGEKSIDWDDFEHAAEVDRTRAEMERDDMQSLAGQLILQADTLDSEWPLVLPETNANGMRVKLLTAQLRDAAHALLSLSAASETGVAA